MSQFDSDEIVHVLGRIPMMQETGRKLFIFDTLVHAPLAWDTIKQKKRSFTHHAKVVLTEKDLEPLKDVYAYFRKEDHCTKQCTDMIMVVVPGAREDTVCNKPLEVAHDVLTC